MRKAKITEIAPENNPALVTLAEAVNYPESETSNMELQERADHRFKVQQSTLEGGNNFDQWIKTLLEDHGINEITRREFIIAQSAVAARSGGFQDYWNTIQAFVDNRRLIPLDDDCPEKAPPTPQEAVEMFRKQFPDPVDRMNAVAAFLNSCGPEPEKLFARALVDAFDVVPGECFPTLVNYLLSANLFLNIFAQYVALRCKPAPKDILPLAGIAERLMGLIGDPRASETLKVAAVTICANLPNTPSTVDLMLKAAGSRINSKPKQLALQWLSNHMNFSPIIEESETANV